MSVPRRFQSSGDCVFKKASRQPGGIPPLQYPRAVRWPKCWLDGFA